MILPRNNTVNKDSYYTLLNENLEESFESSNASIFQEDGAPSHTVKQNVNWLKDCGTDCIEDWPGNSPDISPLKIFGRLSRENYRTLTQHQLKSWRRS